MAHSRNKPLLDKRMFWDINFDALDYDKKATFIIERVFERGDVEDIRQVRRYYGDDLLCKTLTNARWVSLNTIYLGCALFNNQLTDYKCFNMAQLNPTHWTY